MDTKNSDLVFVLNSLQSHWKSLENELAQIKKDITTTKELEGRYGLKFSEPLNFLNALKRKKYEHLKAIIKNMEGFNSSLSSGRKLLKDLNKDSKLESFKNEVPKMDLGLKNIKTHDNEPKIQPEEAEIDITQFS